MYTITDEKPNWNDSRNKKLNKTSKNFSDHLISRLDHAWKKAKLDDKVEKLDHSVRVDEKIFF